MEDRTVAWLLAAGRQKPNMWQGRGKFCGLWPPASPRSPGIKNLA